MVKKTWLFVIYLVVGIYIINMGFELIQIPEKILLLDKWILLIGGVLVIFSGFRFLKDRYLT